MKLTFHPALHDSQALAMCNYWTKKYLCGCDSHVFRNRCPIGLRSDVVCDIMDREDEPHKSYFQCFDCIKREVEQEKIQAARTAQLAEKDRRKAEEQSKKDADKARQVQIRAEAEVRAQRERDEEVRRARDRKAEAERAKREGGAWVDAGSSKKGRGRKGTGGVNVRGGNGDASLPPTPVSAPPAFSGFKKEMGGVFGPLTAKEPMMGPMGSMGMASATSPTTAAHGPPPPAVGIARPRSPLPKTDLRLPPKPEFAPGSRPPPPSTMTPAAAPKGVDPGGRAGHWGPKHNNSHRSRETQSNQSRETQSNQSRGDQSRENHSRENQSPKKILKNDARSNIA
ncbi:hypothetical protein K491DRAFT_711316 [Lophiostoma macrostomum CBS 122681]|uniref:Uncharacterized protein n=1 Tax=Lophiostoma macrostomum CBS 122681 TaxID=1314788 RepID=A0A6A6TPF1_9PLEO|nr:hypothetical protein K491DRAFT_711316 [Lophiostoma macrostomum CBS 122681]